MKKPLSIVLLAAVFLAGCSHNLPATKRPGFASRPVPVWLRVNKIVTAAAVQNGEPVNESATFDKTVNRVYTWTEVETDSAPVKIKHSYYADNKQIAEVKLAVKAKSSRIWSSQRVWPGEWEVDVADEDGNVICITSFTVSNTTEHNASKVEKTIQGK